MMSGLSSLFGWSGIASSSPQILPKADSFDHIFTNVSQKVQDVSLCIDCSGSTLFNSAKSFDNRNFSEIYADALQQLDTELSALTKDYDVVCWSSKAVKLSPDEKIVYKSLVQSKTPIAAQIPDMNRGTEPQTILCHTNNKTTILVTDGEIGDGQMFMIKSMLAQPEYAIGAVFLIIVPHIDSYKGMYSNTIESSAKDSIRLSIPQAFSERLATVIIWNHKMQKFEMIQELTANWVDSTKSLATLINSPTPVVPNGEFLIKTPSSYKSFSLQKLLTWLKESTIDSTTITNLINLGVTFAIRQQASQQQKDQWNMMIQNIFNKLLADKIKYDYVEQPVPIDLPMLEKIKIVAKNEYEKSKLEKLHRSALSDLCGQLLVDKTVSEMKNVAASKSVQTTNNVAQFNSMSQQDKLAEIAPALTVGECSICNNMTNIFKTVSIPAKLMGKLALCCDERQTKGKKGRIQTIKTLNIDLMKAALDEEKARFHFIGLCASCATLTLKQGRMAGDPDNFVSNLIPQNQVYDPVSGSTVVKDRLFMCPLIAASKMDPICDPNESKLSFSRQWLRGFISKVVGLDPASVECMNACLLFLSSLAIDNETASIVYPTQVSLLRGGRVDRYRDTIGRLFNPVVTKISSEVINTISLVCDTIEHMDIKDKIHPESNKLLLLCLIERKVRILVNAKEQRAKVEAKLGDILQCLANDKTNHIDQSKFGITDVLAESIKAVSSSEDYITANPDKYTLFIATFLQNHMNVNLDSLVYHEKSLMRVLTATNPEEVSAALNLNNEYMCRMIERSNMTVTQFVEMLPKFINVLATSERKANMGVIMSFL
jgi:hypothetical protein